MNRDLSLEHVIAVIATERRVWAKMVADIPMDDPRRPNAETRRDAVTLALTRVIEALTLQEEA